MKRIALTVEGREVMHGSRSDRVGSGSIRKGTEPRASEAEMHSDGKGLEEVQHIVPMGSWELDVQASEFHGSEGFFRIFDWTPSAAALPFGKVMDAIPPADRDGVNRILKNTLRTHEPFDLEHQVVRGDGTVRVVRSCGQIVTDLGGGSARLVGTILDITDEKLAHEELQQSEERLTLALEAAYDGQWDWDLTTGQAYFSPRYFTMLGYAVGELPPSYDTWMQLLHPDDRPRVVPAIQGQIERKEDSFEVEFRLRTKNGEFRWILCRGKVVARDGEGRPQRMVGTHMDITERQQAEEAMRRSETKFRTLYESTTDAVMLADDNAFLDCNQAALAVYGCATREEFCSRHPADLSPPTQPCGTDSLTLANQHIATAIKKGSNHFEWVHKRADTGEIFQADVLLSTMELDGKPVVQAVVRDITERQQAEEALRLSQFSVEHASDAIFWMDPQGRIVYVNEAACRSLGRSREELLSLSIPDIDPLFPKEAWGAIWEKVKTRGSMTFETRHQTKQGRVFPVEVTSNYLEYAGKEYSFAFARDITERKRAEDALRESEQRYSLLFDQMLVGFALLEVIYDENGKPCDCRYLEVNPAFETHTGLPRDRILGRAIREIVPDIEPFWIETYGKVAATGESVHFENYMQPLQKWFEVTAFRTHPGHVGVTFADITKRKQGERYQNLSAEILGILNEPLGVADVVDQILAAIKGETGVDAVGIRLRSGDDFPYFVQSGFSQEFLITENTLIARDNKGGPCRDKDSNISLECTCGLVISGQTDGANPLFTKGGSFWTNNSLPLLDLTAHQDPRLHPRNKCIHQGYCSVALIPIRAHHDIVGLLQLNDRKKNCFTLEMIHFLEGISASVGVALMRKQQEDALRQSEAKLKEALLAAQMGVWEWTRATDTATWDENLYRIAGRDPKLPAPGPRKQSQIFAPESTERLEAMEENALTTGTSFELDLELVRPDRSKRWVIGRGEPVRDASGLITGLRGTVQDVTERKQAEEELALFKHSIDVHYDGAYWVDADNRIIYFNDAGCEDLGYEREELKGKTVLDISPDASPEDMKRVWESLRRQGFVSKESVHRRKDGSEYPVDLVITYVQFAGREFACAFARDITERKRAEAESTRLAAIVNSSDDAILSTTREGLIATWNAGAQRLYGYAAEEIKGKHFSVFLPDDRRGDIAGNEERLSRGEALVHFELENIRKDGSRLPVSLTISPIKDAAGIVAGASIVARDISERKQAEREMRKAKEAAEAANRAKSQFLANMSHEIRTPMNGVIGMAGLLLDTELTSEQQQYAEIVRTSGEALLVVINDILDFSKIEARKLHLEITNFDLHSVLEYAAAVLAVKASEKGLELTCELEAGTPWLLRGDPGRVRQVLVNLLGNGVKFTPQGEVAVRVRLEAEDEHRATLRFTVRDTGIGFRQGRASILFEPFAQGDGSMTRRYGGTGLGLAISKQLVEMMGGQIGVESEEGKGSTFWFTAVFEKQPRPSTPATDAQPGLHDIKVLVVDDNATNRSLVCRLLSSWGCHSEESADGNSALAILRRAAQGADPFRVALLDMSLPGMDGEELGRRIAADPQLKPTALVLMTGFCRRRHSDWARLKALGFTGHVAKPIWERSLREALLPLGATPRGAARRPPRVVRGNSRARILVVEDNLTNREVAVAILSKLGHDADVVADGKAAVRALRQVDYDVVLMDCEMPEMDGYEATRRIRQRQGGTRNPDIPIIAITADAMTGDRDKCLQAGMSDYLAKPIEPRQLADVLEKWLSTPADGEAKPPADPSPAKTLAVFDQAALLARLSDDRGLASKVIAGFLSDVPRLLRALKNKLDARDARGAQLQAHTLKGAAAAVSAEALLGLCFEAQEAAAAGELIRASALLPRLEEQFELLKATLTQSGWV